MPKIQHSTKIRRTLTSKFEVADHAASLYERFIKLEKGDKNELMKIIYILYDFKGIVPHFFTLLYTLFLKLLRCKAWYRSKYKKISTSTNDDDRIISEINVVFKNFLLNDSNLKDIYHFDYRVNINRNKAPFKSLGGLGGDSQYSIRPQTYNRVVPNMGGYNVHYNPVPRHSPTNSSIATNEQFTVPTNVNPPRLRTPPNAGQSNARFEERIDGVDGGGDPTVDLQVQAPADSDGIEQYMEQLRKVWFPNEYQARKSSQNIEDRALKSIMKRNQSYPKRRDREITNDDIADEVLDMAYDNWMKASQAPIEKEAFDGGHIQDWDDYDQAIIDIVHEDGTVGEKEFNKWYKDDTKNHKKDLKKFQAFRKEVQQKAHDDKIKRAKFLKETAALKQKLKQDLSKYHKDKSEGKVKNPYTRPIRISKDLNVHEFQRAQKNHQRAVKNKAPDKSINDALKWVTNNVKNVDDDEESRHSFGRRVFTKAEEDFDYVNYWRSAEEHALYKMDPNNWPFSKYGEKRPKQFAHQNPTDNEWLNWLTDRPRTKINLFSFFLSKLREEKGDEVAAHPGVVHDYVQRLIDRYSYIPWLEQQFRPINRNRGYEEDAAEARARRADNKALNKENKRMTAGKKRKK